MPKRLLLPSLVLATVLLAAPALAQGEDERTVGLFKNTPAAFDGYTLFNSLNAPTTYLIDMEGREVNSWTSQYQPGNGIYLLPEGWLARTANLRGVTSTRFNVVGGIGGLIEVYDWDGDVIWSYQLANDQRQFHHDIEPIVVDGRTKSLLAIAFEYHSPAEALAAGRRPEDVPDDGIWSEVILEIEPTAGGGAEVVWEWRAWDHLVQDVDPTKNNYVTDVADHPDRININYAVEGRGAYPEDWLHFNAVAYDPVYEQVVMSSPVFGEVWVIDQTTTTAEAATSSGGRYGQGGDLLYRWGNPEAYDRGGPEDQDLFGQHDPTWIPQGTPGAGRLIIFNNGRGRPEGAFSSIDEVRTPRRADGSYPEPPPGQPWGPATPTKSLTAPVPTDFYASFVSSVQRLPNGNYLVCDGPDGRFIEVGPNARSIAWEYVNPVITGGAILDWNEPIPPAPAGQPSLANRTFRATRYATDFAGFIGQDLTPGDPIENYPDATVAARTADAGALALTAGPNPFAARTTLRFGVAEAGPVRLTVYDVLGREVARLAEGTMEAGPQRVTFEASGLPAGVYLVRLEAGDRVETRRITRLR